MKKPDQYYHDHIKFELKEGEFDVDHIISKEKLKAFIDELSANYEAGMDIHVDGFQHDDGYGKVTFSTIREETDEETVERLEKEVRSRSYWTDDFQQALDYGKEILRKKAGGEKQNEHS